MCFPRRAEDLVYRQQRFTLDRAFVVGALGAIGAIFRAAACLDAQETADLDLAGVVKRAMDRLGLEKKLREGLFVELPDFLQGPVMTRRGSISFHIFMPRGGRLAHRKLQISHHFGLFVPFR
jgi:hypothetical protein